MRRDRRPVGSGVDHAHEAESAALVVSSEPVVERTHDAFVSYVQMNAAFLTQVIVSRDAEFVDGTCLPSEALHATNAYRATAALPRRRPVGHVLTTDR